MELSIIPLLEEILEGVSTRLKIFSSEWEYLYKPIHHFITRNGKTYYGREDQGNSIDDELIESFGDFLQLFKTKEKEIYELNMYFDSFLILLDEEKNINRRYPPFYLNLDYFLNTIYLLSNYGLDRLGEDIAMDLRERVIEDDRYTIIAKGWQVRFDFDESLFPSGEYRKNGDYVVRHRTQGYAPVQQSLKGLIISLRIEIIDKEAYQIGGEEYLQAKERYERRK